MSDLGRSDLLALHQCLRRAWLRARGVERSVAQPGGVRREDLTLVTMLARRRYPGGVAVEGAEDAPDVRLDETRRLMADPAVPAVFDAWFRHAGVLVRAPIVSRLGEGWAFVEARCAAALSEAQELDIAATAWVASGAGVVVTGRRALHLDRDYVRSGEIDPGPLFAEVEIPQTDFGPWARLACVTDADREPAVEPGEQCSRPRACEFAAHCTPAPGPYSVRRLPRTGRLQLELKARGIEDVRDLPSDIRMNPSQQHAAWAMVNAREYVGQGLRPALENVVFPIRFLDVEATQIAVPRWHGARPFEQLPTQWSMHRLEHDGGLSHCAFLHTEASDPRAAFVRALVEAAGTEGTIIVYGSFELTILRALRDLFPEAWQDLDGILDRVMDLFTVVRDHYYHPSLDGRFSMKALVGALCPELDYGQLAIRDGFGAALAWQGMVAADTSPEERSSIAENLRLYCARDTLAMVRVRAALLSRARGEATGDPRSLG